MLRAPAPGRPRRARSYIYLQLDGRLVSHDGRWKEMRHAAVGRRRASALIPAAVLRGISTAVPHQGIRPVTTSDIQAKASDSGCFAPACSSTVSGFTGLFGSSDYSWGADSRSCAPKPKILDMVPGNLRLFEWRSEVGV